MYDAWPAPLKIDVEARCTTPGALNDWPQEARNIKSSVGVHNAAIFGLTAENPS